MSIPDQIDVFSTDKYGETETVVLQIDYRRLNPDRLRSADINPETAVK